MRSTFHKNSFNSGEVSPRFMGRYDLDKYPNAVKIMENFLIYQLGGALFRPGTIFSAEVKDSTKETNLIPFQYSTSQAYDIEVGDLYMRFFSNQAPVGAPLEIVTPFAQADIFNLHFAQNADTMYITNQKYHPQKLIRLSATLFAIGPVNFIRGPFMDDNVGNVTITPSSATGATTITATVPAWGTGTNYIVNDFVTQGGVHYRCTVPHKAGTFATDLASGYWVAQDFFQSGHVDSLWKIHSAVVKITTYTSKTVLVGAVQAEPDGTAGNIGGTTAYSDWAEGAFSTYRGFPATVAFHQQRLVYANTPTQPQTMWGSTIGAYDDFNVGTTADDDSFIFTPASDQPNPLRWLKSNYNKLSFGTAGGSGSANGSSSSVITPTDIDIRFDTDWAAATIQAQRISSYLLYLQSNGFQLRELVYDFYTDRFIAKDMNLLADHILRDGDGAVFFDKQQSPNSRFWIGRSDGQIAVLTRNPEQDVMGWSRIVAGSTAAGPGLFEAVSITRQDDEDDQICVIVKRNITGSVKRYIEYFSPEMFVNQWEPIRLDCSLTYNSPKTISGISNATQGIVTATSHGFSDGDYVKIDLVKVVDSNNQFSDSFLDGNFYIVSDKTTHTFKIKDENGDYIDTTLMGVYSSGGEARKMITAVSGLSHLEGETVSVTVDGAMPSKQQTYTVSGGAITLAEKAAVVTVGLPYIGTLVLLKLSDGMQPSGQTKSRRIYLSTLRVVQSLGFQIGQDIDHMTTKFFRSPNDPLGKAPPLVTGDVEKYFDSWWDKETEVVIRQTQPLPLFILSLTLRSDVEDR
jgi:hypothetical protein